MMYEESPQYLALKRYLSEIERAVGVRSGETLIQAINRINSLNAALTRELCAKEIEIAKLKGGQESS